MVLPWKEENMQNAIAYYNSGKQRGNKKIKLGSAASRYGIPYNTLKYRLTGDNIVINLTIMD